ncbi:PREDICTED: uncharacterized protein LOC104819282 [Tarenaya hassleriana]|uniref:uncharacterized protein LOC104819282 n=1 Tax=Tarenaya hassleriana TaxID=28532 RepID=UPI00053C3246|nr:PREDICTED: uncharacterized protein LOC104819282 [Tarenaya hassleriana]
MQSTPNSLEIWNPPTLPSTEHEQGTNRRSDKDMEATTELKEKIFEIFKDFMTRITKLEELENGGKRFLLGFQQALRLLQRPPIDNSSKLMENILKNNETRRLKSYIKAGCINTHDASQSTKTLHTCMLGLHDHLIKAKSLLTELECLVEDASLAIETATKFSTHLCNESCDPLHQVTNDEEELTGPYPQESEIREYGVVIAIIYSMVKQNYVMQEKIVKSLGFKSSSGELEGYTLMWSLRPFVEEEIVNQAWKFMP